ncbi:hypothetical protein IC582_021441 [Cucumis melo]
MNNCPHWHSEELMCVGVTIEFWREDEILSKLHHPNVVVFYDVVQDGPGGTSATCSFEGGIAGEPGSEAHGGCTFCGLATLILVNEVHQLDLQSLLVRLY